MKAWTLGYPPAYEQATKIPGNAKAPGGYAFRTRMAALSYAASHAEAERYGPFPIYLPGTFDECTTTDYATAAQARHEWHSDVREFMPYCGVCINHLDQEIDCALLIVAAPFQP